MASTDKKLTADDLSEIRALRALLVEAYGTIEDLSRLEFAVGMDEGDVLAAFGLGGSLWAGERLAQLRAGLDAPLAAAVNRGREKAGALADARCMAAA